MNVSLDKFRAYGQQPTDMSANIRVGHFGKLKETAPSEGNAPNKTAPQTTPSENRKVRTTLLKAMRADLKSSFGGVFRSKRNNLKWLAARLTGNPQVAGKALNAGSVKVLLAQYDDYKAELKQSLDSAKQLFHGRELTAQYKELQKATPAEIRGMRSMWSVRQNGGTQTAAQAQLRADIGSAVQKMLNPMNAAATVRMAFELPGQALQPTDMDNGLTSTHLPQLKDLTEQALLNNPPASFGGAYSPEDAAKVDSAVRKAVTALRTLVALESMNGEQLQLPENRTAAAALKMTEVFCSRLPAGSTAAEELRKTMTLDLLGGTPAENAAAFRSTLQGLAAVVLEPFADDASAAANLTGRLQTLAETGDADTQLRLAANLCELSAIDRTSAEGSLRAATAVKALTVLFAAADAGHCDAAHILDVQAQVFTETPYAVQFISDALDIGVVHPLPRSHAEVNMTLPKDICGLQLAEFSKKMPSGDAPVPESVLSGSIVQTQKDADRGENIIINGKQLPGSGNDHTKALTVADTDAFFNDAVEQNLPEGLTEAQRTLLATHSKWAAASFVNQTMEAIYQGPMDSGNYDFRPLPFSEVAGGSRTLFKEFELTGDGNGGWNLRYTSKGAQLSQALLLGSNRELTDRLIFFDPSDDANRLEVTFDLRISVNLTDSGAVETTFSYAKPPEAHAVLDARLYPER